MAQLESIVHFEKLICKDIKGLLFAVPFIISACTVSSIISGHNLKQYCNGKYVAMPVPILN